MTPRDLAIFLWGSFLPQHLARRASSLLVLQPLHTIPATSSRMSIATLYIFTTISRLLNFYLLLLLDHWHPRTLNCSNQRVMHPLGRYQIPSSHTRLRSSSRSSWSTYKPSTSPSPQFSDSVAQLRLSNRIRT
jgi:hypothetical protein